MVAPIYVPADGALEPIAGYAKKSGPLTQPVYTLPQYAPLPRIEIPMDLFWDSAPHWTQTLPAPWSGQFGQPIAQANPSIPILKDSEATTDNVYRNPGADETLLAGQPASLLGDEKNVLPVLLLLGAALAAYMARKKKKKG